MPQLGEKITVAEADRMIDQRSKVKAVSSPFITNAVDENKDFLDRIGSGQVPPSPFHELFTKVKGNFLDGTNAYIFSKEDIMRYFDGDASADGGAGTANYLMILVGAHHADRAPYDRGDQAVIIAGCNTTAVPNTFNTLPWIKPATEHPPMKSVERLPRLASFDNIDYIEVTFQ